MRKEALQSLLPWQRFCLPIITDCRLVPPTSFHQELPEPWRRTTPVCKYERCGIFFWRGR